MIRRAEFVDVPAIYGLIEEMYRASPYVGIDEIDEKYTRALILNAIRGHGRQTDGGTLVIVSEHKGCVTGFTIGVLERLYHIGTKLMATDLFTFNSPSGSARDGLKLFNTLIEWAEENPAVVEVKFGAVDMIESYERTEKFFRRMGLRQCGVIYQRSIER